MKRLLCTPVCLLLLALLSGAAAGRAPIVPTVDFYVNDAANVIVEQHRDRMMAVSADLDDKTGAQLVVLTVDGITGGGTLRELAEAVFTDWEIGGRASGNGVLILTLSKPADCVIHVGEGLRRSMGANSVEALEADLRASMKGGNLSKAILERFKEIASRLYSVHGATPSREIASILSAEENGGFSLAPMIILVVVVLITGRSMRIARRNQKRTKGPIHKRKSFKKKAIDEDNLPRPESLSMASPDSELTRYDEPEEVFLDDDPSSDYRNS